MSDRLDGLLDELARRQASGAELDVAGLMEQAGDEADRFAELADRLLAEAPRREPTPETMAYLATLAEPPLLRVRLTRRLKVKELVAELGLSLKTKELGRLGDYYMRLEGGLLDPTRVDARVWIALERLLGAPVRELARVPTGDVPTDLAFYRITHDAAAAPGVAEALGAPHAAPARAKDPAPAERDELDRLFLGAT